MKQCLSCNAQFDGTDYRRKFCSRSCSAKYSNTRRVKTLYKKSTKKCQHCGSSLKNYQTRYCSSVCDGQAKKKLAETKILSGHPVSVNTLRAYLLDTRPNICNICNGDSWFGNPMPLVMDHIDGCATNNSLQNLRLICPNCDRFTPTFGARNRGNGRQSLGIKRYDKYDKEN